MEKRHGLSICNLMPHRIIVLDAYGNEIGIPSSGYVSRCHVVSTNKGSICLSVDGSDTLFRTVEQVFSTPIIRNNKGDVLPFPSPVKDTVYIASTLVAKSLRRPDVLSPDTTSRGAIRDNEGKIIAVNQLQTFSMEKQ